MHGAVRYSIFFVALVLLQAFLFNNLNLGTFINPLVYVAFVVLLPMGMGPVWVLTLGLALGVSVDALVGTAGLNTIATLATAFARRGVMTLLLGKETIGDGGTPSSARLGANKFMRYCSALVVLHCAVFFSMEAFGTEWTHFTLLKIVISSIFTLVLIYFSQLLFRE